MSLPFLMANWPASSHIHACTTFRSHPYSNSDFNLSPFVGCKESAQKNRMILSQALELSCPLPWLKQVHGSDVVEATNQSLNVQADGSWTQSMNQVCVVLTADCLPIVLTDELGSVICALHGGWRGLAQGIIEQGVTKLRQVSSTPLMAWLGPAIGPQSFQVGPEVREAFVTDQPCLESAFTPDSSRVGHFLGNLYEVAKLQLNLLGVDQVYGGDFCTYTDCDRFFSYRKESACGRMATLIWRSD